MSRIDFMHHLRSIVPAGHIRTLFAGRLWCIPIIVLAGLLSSATEIVGISLLVPLFTEGEPAGITGRVTSYMLGRTPSATHQFWILIFLVCTVVLKGAALYANASVSAWVSQHSMHVLASRIFSRIVNIDYAELIRNESGEMLSYFTSELHQIRDAVNTVQQLAVTTVMTIAFTTILFVISWQLTVVVFAGVVLVAGLVHQISRAGMRAGLSANRAESDFAQLVWDTLANIKSVHVFQLQEVLSTRAESYSDTVRSVATRTAILFGTIHPLSEALQAVLLVLIFVIGRSIGMATTSLLVFVILLYRLQPHVKTFYSSALELTAVVPVIERILPFAAEVDTGENKPGGTAFGTIQEQIRFENVEFRYDGESVPALADVSVSIPKGKLTAIVGPSGSGKSTFANLLCRFYQPAGGRITVDGAPLDGFDIRSWRSRVSFIGHEPHLFSASVFENIRYGRLSATETEVIEAAGRAGALKFIERLPEGMLTAVGSGGAPLSAGQCQQIALARAILRDPELLIFDEATNALDTISEQGFFAALADSCQGRTIVFIAHRLAAAANADHIIVMQQGQVAETGSAADLLRNKGLFADMIAGQNWKKLSANPAPTAETIIG